MAPLVNEAVIARSACGLSQERFAALLGISVKTLQNWEQCRYEPTGPAKTLLRVIAVNPQAVVAALTPA